MRSNIPFLFFAWAVVVSCRSYPLPDIESDSKSFFSHEWISFDVSRSVYTQDTWQFDLPKAHVILHNLCDTVQEMAVVDEDGVVFLLTRDRFCCIDTGYQYIVSYPAGNLFYDEAVLSVLQNPLDYFPMYYPYGNAWRMAIDDHAVKKEILDGDTLFVIKGTKVVKHCYSNGTCELDDVQVHYVYSTQRKNFVKAAEVTGLRSKVTSEISNLKFKDQSNVWDSIFDFENIRYAAYDRISEDQYFPDRTIMSRNTIANDTVLDWPIVSLATGDTVSLRQMSGNTIVYLFNRHLDSSWYHQHELAVLGATCRMVWLMPWSSNAEWLSNLAQKEHLGDNIYYAKGFTNYLSSANAAYLINGEHRVVSCFNKSDMNFNSWIELLKRDEKL